MAVKSVEREVFDRAKREYDQTGCLSDASVLADEQLLQILCPPVNDLPSIRPFLQKVAEFLGLHVVKYSYAGTSRGGNH